MPKQSFYLPDLGEGLSEATLRHWHIQVGQTIETGAIIAVVETAKTMIELPSPYTGTVHRLLAKIDEKIIVGQALFSLETNAPSIVGHCENHTDTLAPTQPPSPPKPYSTLDPHLPKDLQAMAHFVTQAHKETVPVTLHGLINIPHTQGLTACLLKALTTACHAAPKLHAHYQAFRYYRPQKTLCVGLAVHGEHGLSLPVIDSVAQKSIPTLQEEILALKQHNTPHLEATKASLVVSNFGSLGGRFGTPLLAPPCVCSLGIGQAFIEHNQLKLPLSITLDHRVASGADAALFMQALEPALQETLNQYAPVVSH